MTFTSLRRSLAVLVALVAGTSNAFAPNAFVLKTRPHRLQSDTAVRTATTTTTTADETTTTITTITTTTTTTAGEKKAAAGEKKAATLPAEVFKGVHLPGPNKVPPRIDNEYTIEQVGTYVNLVGPLFPNIVGQPKTKTSLSVLEKLVGQVNNYAANVPSEDYKFFGNGDHAKELPLILKTNPFFASGLTETCDGFELKSYDPAENKPSLFLQILRTLNGVGHRVNFQFDSHMNIKSFQVFDDIEGKEIQGDLDLQTYASSALYNLFFYASSVHATIHVLHYLLTSALQYTSQDFEALNEWATVFSKNIVQKYDQVGTLLLTDPPAPGVLDKSLVSGIAGFGSSQAIRPILKNLLDTWGNSPTAEGFLDNMMNISEKKMERAGILTEFKKHTDLIRPFAKDAAKALYKTDKNEYGKAERNLKLYLNDCGSFKSNINTIEDWIELMSVTGVVHGSTLSYTRFLGRAEIARWNDFWNGRGSPCYGFDREGLLRQAPSCPR